MSLCTEFVTILDFGLGIASHVWLGVSPSVAFFFQIGIGIRRSGVGLKDGNKPIVVLFLDLNLGLMAAKVLPHLTHPCILLCQKSDCWKRGGKAICRVLEGSLRDRPLRRSRQDQTYRMPQAMQEGT